MDQTLTDVTVPGSGSKVPVSVVIPCYRCCHTIRDAVDSVLNQTTRPVEIIMVEDCSGDGGRTLSLLEAIRLEVQGLIRIVVMSLPENRGAGEARNAGWSAADQEFVAFLDADDAWYPRKLEIQVAWMSAHADYLLTCHDSKVCSGSRSPPLPVGRIPIRAVEWRLLLFRNEIATRTVMVRRGIFHRFPLAVRHAEDYQLWLRILLDGGTAMRLCLPLACSYKEEFGAGGLSGDLAAMHRGVLCCLDDLCKDHLISQGMHSLAVAFEMLKYWRRVAVTVARKWHRLDETESPS